MKLRWLFLLIFASGLATSAAYGLGAGQKSTGWLAAALISIAGLAWTWWGEPETGSAANWSAASETAAVAQSELARNAVVADGEMTAEMTGLEIEANSERTASPKARAAEESAARAAARLAGPAMPLALGARFEEFFQRSPVPMVVMDRNGQVERMNEAAEAITEFAAAEVRKQAYWDVFLDEAERKAAERDFRLSMMEKTAPPRRETWKTRTGTLAAFDWLRTILKDDFGQAEGLMAVALPVAEPTVAAPVDLTALADQLTTVNGYSELLLESVGTADPIRGDLEAIHRAGIAATERLRAI